MWRECAIPEQREPLPREGGIEGLLAGREVNIPMEVSGIINSS